MINRENYLYQKKYLEFIENTKNRGPQTIRQAKSHTNHFLLWLDDVPIAKADKKDGSFPKHLAEHRQRKNHNDDTSYSGLHPTTQKKVLQTVKNFLQFLQLTEPDKMKSLPLIWIEALNPVPTVELPPKHEFITHEEILIIAQFEVAPNNLRLKRAQAAACFLYASAARNGAFTSSPAKAIDLENLEYHQWPSHGVRTKNRVHKTTFLLNVPEILEPIKQWDKFINENLPPEALWFASLDTNTFGNKNSLSTSTNFGKNRSKLLNNDLKYLCEMVDLPYKSAHKYRHGHAVFALLNAKTMAQYKAISQNFMHKDIRVTDTEYAWFNDDEIKNQIMNLTFNSNRNNSDTLDKELEIFLNSLSKGGLTEAINYAAKLLANS